MALSPDKQRTLNRLRASTLEQEAEKKLKKADADKKSSPKESRSKEIKAKKLSEDAVKTYRGK